MEAQPCVFLGIKVQTGPIQRHKIENFTLDNTVESLKTQAEIKSSIPSASLVLVHHGKILKDGTTLQDNGIKNGETIHVVKKKPEPAVEDPQSYTDADLTQIVTSMRSFGCTPNAPGWTRAMQVLNDESTMSEMQQSVPSLLSDCVTVSILHEVELLAALGSNVTTMRRGAEARPDLVEALRHLIRLVRSRGSNASGSTDTAPTSGFSYSLEALSEDEDADDEDNEDGERNTITQEQVAAALQAATQSVSGSGSQDSLMRLLQATGSSSRPNESTSGAGSSNRTLITPEMFSEAITGVIGNRPRNSSSAVEQNTSGSSSQSDSNAYAEQLQHMHEMGLRNDALNVSALIICSGDVNAAINLVLSGGIGDD